MPDRVVKACIVLGCGWKHEIPPPPNVSPVALAGAFGAGTMQDLAMARYHEEIEKTLEMHLAGHSLVEWARTVMLWKERAEQASALAFERGRELERLRATPPSGRGGE